MIGKVALIGAAGAIGKTVARTLDARGLEYRVVGRNRAALETAFAQSGLATISTWNPDDPTSVRAAVRGADTLVYLVGVPYDQFQLHPVLMKRTLEGASAEGVKQMLLIGTVYPYGMPRTTPVKEDHPREAHTFKGRMRKEQEDALLEADAAGKIRGAVLRLPDFYGPGVERSLLDGIFQAAAHGKTANMIGPIDTPHEFVFVPDVGPVVLALIDKPEAYGRWWHLAGPGVMTQREIAEHVFEMVGRKPRLRVAGNTTLRLLGIFNPFLRELVEMNYLFTNPLLLNDSALHGLLGEIHKTPYEEGLRLSLAAARQSRQT
ncbi:MAG: NAD-dependent epimerase/dehydratase family protein [Acidobacteriaceae bacterium]|nr:NAD-dependent epimerase/dehydratase family protein [Acidobacteriaceae bacterium]